MDEIKRLKSVLNVPINPTMKAALRVLAANRGLSLADVVRMAIIYYIQNTCPAEYDRIYNDLLAKERINQ